MAIPQQAIETEAARFSRLSQEVHKKLQGLADKDRAYQRFIALNEQFERELRQ